MVERFAFEECNIELICKYDVINHSIDIFVLGALRIDFALSKACPMFLDVALYHLVVAIVTIKGTCTLIIFS